MLWTVNNKTGSHVTEKISKRACFCKVYFYSLEEKMESSRFASRGKKEISKLVEDKDSFSYLLLTLTLGMIIKHLFTGTSGKQYVLWSLDR